MTMEEIRQDQKEMAQISRILETMQGTTKLCPAPDASDEGKRSSGIGEQPLSGLNVSDGLTLLQNSSVMILKELEYQRKDIKEMQQSIQFLAQQVKTLVDALAEDADPDAPLTNYLSGKPV
jgi:hypothetical protein